MFLQRRITREKCTNTFMCVYHPLLVCSLQAKVSNFLVFLIHHQHTQAYTALNGQILLWLRTCTCENLDPIRPQMCGWLWKQEGWEEVIFIVLIWKGCDQDVNLYYCCKHCSEFSCNYMGLTLHLRVIWKRQRQHLQPVLGLRERRKGGALWERHGFPSLVGHWPFVP